jgi:MoxR-like ATPase
MSELAKLLQAKKIDDLTSSQDIILEGQYQQAYDIMLDAYNAGLYSALIGPVGAGKTALCRKFAQDQKQSFHWVTFSDLVRPSNLIGSFDPTLVFQLGYSVEAFVPGPFTLAALQGGIFFANELNRGDEYVLNSLLDALEERKLYIPALRSWYQVDPKFYLIAAMNPSEMRGTRGLSTAIKDRIKVWIPLDYPSKSMEHKIVLHHCQEYQLSGSQIELVMELMQETRCEAGIEIPASIRSSIAIARLAAQKSLRTKEPLDNRMMAGAARLVLKEAIKMKPGRDMDNYIQRLLKKIFGTDGKG